MHGVAGPNGGNSALCHFAQPGRDLFFDLYFERPEYRGGGAGMLTPFPAYDSGEGLSEAIAGPGVTINIGVPGSY